MFCGIFSFPWTLHRAYPRERRGAKDPSSSCPSLLSSRLVHRGVQCSRARVCLCISIHALRPYRWWWRRLLSRSSSLLPGRKNSTYLYDTLSVVRWISTYWSPIHTKLSILARLLRTETYTHTPSLSPSLPPRLRLRLRLWRTAPACSTSSCSSLFPSSLGG